MLNLRLHSGKMVEIPARAWFTQVSYRNAASPLHLDAADLELNNRMKQEQVLEWIVERVRGKQVLYLFCANGAFSFEAARAGAKEVVDLDFNSERVRCADFIASTLDGTFTCVPRFTTGNVYELTRIFKEPFDVVLALGGLYHVADPPHVLTQLRTLTLEMLIVQTSSILPLPGNWVRFVIREDQSARGLTTSLAGAACDAIQCSASKTFSGMPVYGRQVPASFSIAPPPLPLDTTPWPSLPRGQ